MSTRISTGLRIAGAGTAAAALTLAAAAPAFAQGPADLDAFEPVLLVNDERFDASSFTVHSTLTENPHPGQMELSFTPEQAAQITNVRAVFEVGSGAAEHVELFSDDEDCWVDNVDVICNVDTTSGDALASGTLAFDFAIGPDAETVVGGMYAYSYLTYLTTTGGETVYDGFSGSFEFEASALEPGDDDVEPTEPPVEDPNESEEGFDYQFAFLNHILSGANPGETLVGSPQIRVNDESELGDDRAATVLYFGDSIDVDAWIDEGEVEFTEAVEIIADYDNCKRIDLEVYCVLTDFDPQVGTTYTTSEDTPVLLEVLKAVTAADGAYYGAYDVTQEGLDEALADGIDPEGANSLTLVEADEQIDDEYFSDLYGFIFFEGDDRGWGNAPGTDEKPLPKTGSSQTIMISSAAAAVLAGAVVFFLVRRRKTAANWE